MDRTPWQKALHMAKLKLSWHLNRPFVKPDIIALFITSHCNLNCIMCSFANRIKENDIGTENMLKMVDRIADFGVRQIDITGGEPFVRKDVFKIIERAHQRNLWINITTNATLLDDQDIERLFQFGVRSLQISIDGAKSETHDKIRGKDGCLKRIIKTVQMINSIKADKTPFPFLNATTVIMRHNVEELVDILHLVRELKFTSITYQPVADSNQDIRIQDPSNPHRVQKEQIPLLEKAIAELLSYKEKNGFICNSKRHFHLILEHFKGNPLNNLKCYSGFFTGTISNDGIFRSVCMGPFGNALEHPLDKLWRSSQAKKVRNAVKNCHTPCLFPCWVDTDML